TSVHSSRLHIPYAPLTSSTRISTVVAPSSDTTSTRAISAPPACPRPHEPKDGPPPGRPRTPSPHPCTACTTPARTPAAPGRHRNAPPAGPRGCVPLPHPRTTDTGTPRRRVRPVHHHLAGRLLPAARPVLIGLLYVGHENPFQWCSR